MAIKSVVPDSSAMLAYLREESGGAVVRSMLQDESTECYAHTVNLTEVYSIISRRSDKATALKAIQSLRKDGVSFRKDMSVDF